MSFCLQLKYVIEEYAFMSFCLNYYHHLYILSKAELLYLLKTIQERASIHSFFS